MASIVDTSVKHAYSSMAGAPVINGTAGSLITALDAFLVTGWGAKAVDSAVISNGVCRLIFASGKSAAETHSVIKVFGATPAGLNGDQRVTAVASNWVEFKTDLPDGPLTGSITFKIAPLGWEKVFSNTNVAVYRSTDPAGTRAYYRVDDTDALFARVQMYESMTDVDTGIAAAPATPAAGFYWHKRSAAGAGGVYWVLLGDSRAFYLSVAPNAGSGVPTSNSLGLCTHFAGDINSYRSGDAWSAALTGALSATYSDLAGDVFVTATVAGIVLQRMSMGIGGVQQVGRYVAGAGISGADSTMGLFPSRADNGLRLTPIVLPDGVMGVSGPRGELPGGYHCPQAGLVAVFGSDVRLTAGTGVFAGKQLLSVGCGSLTAAATGCGVFDATGPWRAE